MTEKVVKFRNRRYVFERGIPTQLSTEYVPDWTLFHAMRESLQNAYDERTLSGAKVDTYPEGDSVLIRDAGRGVAFEDILLLGISGKRGLDNVVGQHGEGEVVSSMVAARLGVTKRMASQDWLVIGRTAQEGEHEILVLDLYRSKGFRKGTCWEFERAGAREYLNDTFKAAKAVFRKQVRNGRIFVDEPGQLFTQGMEVNKITNLALGYNLRATPGRDRSGFTWSQCQDEIEQLLAVEGKPAHFAALLLAGCGWGLPLEFDLRPLVSLEIVKKASRLAAKECKKIVWAVSGQASYRADACEQGMGVIDFGYRVPPDWVTDNFPNVVDATAGTYGGRACRELPATMRQVIAALSVVIPGELPECKIVTMERDVLAVAKGMQVIFNRSYLKKSSIKSLVSTMAHEMAHISSGQEDCTRAHAAATTRIMASIVDRLATSEEARVAYAKAKTLLKHYQK